VNQYLTKFGTEAANLREGIADVVVLGSLVHPNPPLQAVIGDTPGYNISK